MVFVFCVAFCFVHWFPILVIIRVFGACFGLFVFCVVCGCVGVPLLLLLLLLLLVTLVFGLFLVLCFGVAFNCF